MNVALEILRGRESKLKALHSDHGATEKKDITFKNLAKELKETLVGKETS